MRFVLSRADVMSQQPTFSKVKLGDRFRSELLLSSKVTYYAAGSGASHATSKCNAGVQSAESRMHDAY